MKKSRFMIGTSDHEVDRQEVRRRDTNARHPRTAHRRRHRDGAEEKVEDEAEAEVVVAVDREAAEEAAEALRDTSTAALLLRPDTAAAAAAGTVEVECRRRGAITADIHAVRRVAIGNDKIMIIITMMSKVCSRTRITMMNIKRIHSTAAMIGILEIAMAMCSICTCRATPTATTETRIETKRT